MLDNDYDYNDAIIRMVGQWLLYFVNSHDDGNEYGWQYTVVWIMIMDENDGKMMGQWWWKS